MALTKEVFVDQIEVVGPYKIVQVRTVTAIKEDGVEVSRNNHRHVIVPGQDTSAEVADVQAICSTMHTQEVIDVYNAYIAEQD